MKKLVLLVLVLVLFLLLASSCFSQDTTSISKVGQKEFNFEEAGLSISKGAKLKNIGTGVNIGAGIVGVLFLTDDKNSKQSKDIGISVIVAGSVANLILQFVGNNFIRNGGLKMASQGIGLNYTLK